MSSEEKSASAQSASEYAPGASGNSGVPDTPVAPRVAQALPTPAVPPAAVPAGSPTVEQLQAQIRQLEAMVNQLSGQVRQLSPGAPAALGATPIAGATTGGPGVLSNIQPGATAPSNVPIPATAFAPSRTGGVGAPGQSLPPNPPPVNRFNSPSTLQSLTLNGRFGPGFEVRSDDDEFILQFHDLTQFDYRGYLQGGQTNFHDGFDFPRQWFMWSGRINKQFGFFISTASNLGGAFNILDVFTDIDFDPRVRLRVGRFKTPFTYEFLVEPIQGLVVPERSIFFNNFAQNRDLGIMPYGRLFNGLVDYAGGIFNGNRNAFLPAVDGKFTSWFINSRPFGNQENTLLENLNVGGSLFAGRNDTAPVPTNLNTVVPTAGSPALGTPFAGTEFLRFNNNVRMFGPMAFWDLHMAYFYRGLAVIGEWGSGYQDYALNSNLAARTHLPVEAYYVQASYLLTGETRSSVGIVLPNNPVRFGRGDGWTGTGAWEPFVRYEYLDIGREVFSNGLSDPNLWANRVWQTHVGINWHLTQYFKLYIDWNHSEFNQPIIFAPNHREKTANLFLVRFQLFF
jgi:phosphate-selective porin OprO/OprP